MVLKRKLKAEEIREPGEAREKRETAWCVDGMIYIHQEIFFVSIRSLPIETAAIWDAVRKGAISSDKPRIRLNAYLGLTRVNRTNLARSALYATRKSLTTCGPYHKRRPLRGELTNCRGGNLRDNAAAS